MDRKQALAYLEEAELTLDSAQAIFAEAKRTGKKLWSKVVKESYDSMENCAAAGLVLRGVEIPRRHPAKVARFISGIDSKEEITGILRRWLVKRARAQYVDFNSSGKLRVPHREFGESDAREALEDCRRVIKFTRGLIRGRT